VQLPRHWSAVMKRMFCMSGQPSWVDRLA